MSGRERIDMGWGARARPPRIKPRTGTGKPDRYLIDSLIRLFKRPGMAVVDHAARIEVNWRDSYRALLRATQDERYAFQGLMRAMACSPDRAEQDTGKAFVNDLAEAEASRIFARWDLPEDVRTAIRNALPSMSATLHKNICLDVAAKNEVDVEERIVSHVRSRIKALTG